MSSSCFVHRNISRSQRVLPLDQVLLRPTSGGFDRKILKTKQGSESNQKWTRVNRIPRSLLLSRRDELMRALAPGKWNATNSREKLHIGETGFRCSRTARDERLVAEIMMRLSGIAS
jgi:hypothetical protein